MSLTGVDESPIPRAGKEHHRSLSNGVRVPAPCHRAGVRPSRRVQKLSRPQPCHRQGAKWGLHLVSHFLRRSPIKKSGAATAFTSAPCRGVIPNQPGKLFQGFSCLALQSKPELFLVKTGCDKTLPLPRGGAGTADACAGGWSMGCGTSGIFRCRLLVGDGSPAAMPFARRKVITVS